MDPIKFEQYKGKIEIALTAKGYSIYKDSNPQGDYILLDNFVNQPIQQELSGNFVIGGPTLPMVVLINKNNGEVKFVALKLIIPDFPLN